MLSVNTDSVLRRQHGNLRVKPLTRKLSVLSVNTDSVLRLYTGFRVKGFRDSMFIFGAQKHGIYIVLGTFGEKRVLRFSSWLGWAPGGLPGAPSWLARGLRSPPGSILGDIFGDFRKILEGFSSVFLPAFFD